MEKAETTCSFASPVDQHRGDCIILKGNPCEIVDASISFSRFGKWDFERIRHTLYKMPKQCVVIDCIGLPNIECVVEQVGEIESIMIHWYNGLNDRRCDCEGARCCGNSSCAMCDARVDGIELGEILPDIVPLLNEDWYYQVLSYIESRYDKSIE